MLLTFVTILAWMLAIPASLIALRNGYKELRYRRNKAGQLLCFWIGVRPVYEWLKPSLLALTAWAWIIAQSAA